MLHSFLLLRLVLIVFCFVAIESATFQRMIRSDVVPRVHPLASIHQQVLVEQTFPGVNPDQAKDAWLEYVWKQGGGLLGTFVVQDDEMTTPSRGRVKIGEERRRRIFPACVQEELVMIPAQDDDSVRNHKNEIHDTTALTLQYHVTDMGILSTWLVPDSHFASVTFQAVGDNNGTTSSVKMTWKVDFESRNWPYFWQAFTQFNIETISDNLASYLHPPIKYTQRTKLRLPDNDDRSSGTKTKEQLLANEWVDFIWKQGGGLPVPFLVLDEQRRIVIPPFLLERLIPSSNDGTIEYTVDNPGLLTYPVHSHRGRVCFESVAAVEGKESCSMVDMVWDVEIRPWRGLAWLVKPFTAAIASTLGRNFKTHVQEPGVMVPLAPPRGKGQAFAQIAKDSWLGGVLAAHLVDRRSTLQQTLSLVQPWTWGRSKATDDFGEIGEWIR